MDARTILIGGIFIVIGMVVVIMSFMASDDYNPCDPGFNYDRQTQTCTEVR